MAMSDLLLRVAIIEKNERGQEVELVRKTMQFKPQVCFTSFLILKSVIIPPFKHLLKIICIF